MARRRQVHLGVVLLCFVLLSVQVVCKEHSLSKTTDGGDDKSIVMETTPPPAESDKQALDPMKIVKGLGDMIAAQLRRGLQWVNAGIAMAAGVVMIVNGEFVFKNLVVGSISVFVFLLSRSFMEAHFHERFPEAVYTVTALEAAVALYWIAERGYAGIQVLIGLLAGGLLYVYVHTFFHERVSESVSESWYFFLIVVNLCLGLGVSLFLGKTHKTAMAVLSSLAGGCLLASSVAFFAMFAAVHFRDNLSEHLHLPSTCPSWVRFLQTLAVPGSEPVGVFANSPYNIPVAKGEASLDRWIGYTVWFLLFTLGVWIQTKKEKKIASAKERKSLEAEALNSPLLLA